MKRDLVMALAIAGLIPFSAPYSSDQGALSTSAVSPPAPARSLSAAPKSFQPGMDDLMTMIVAPRHIKLYYAGAAKNWELAAFEARTLRAAIGRIVTTIPMYAGQDVNATVEAITASHLDATDSAIAAGDPARFAKAYKELTESCNACHTYLEHPFLVIVVPPAAPNIFPDQSFKALSAK